MLNGAKKTTFDIARISTSEVTFQNSNSDNFTSPNFPFNNYRHNVDVFDIFSTPLFPLTPNPRTSPPFVTHTRSRFQKKRFFLFTPHLYFFSPPASTKLLIRFFFCSLNEILHKLTSCHFTLRNKTLNDLCLKILPFSLLRTKLYNSSENNNSNT